jgi:hypothetical protein
MTSTRNKNMPNEYKIQQQFNSNIMDNNLYINSQYGKPISEYIPSVGYMPSHMSRDSFSNNSIDIESTLYGIGSTNLVNGCQTVVPSMKNIYFKNWFDRPNSVIMPPPMFYNQERPNMA